MAAIIEVEHVSKNFGGVAAVRDCSLSVEAGSITGLIGPNGAGKSTLFNLIAGTFPVSSGAIRLEGRDVTSWPAHRLFSAGLVRTFQIAHEFSAMTVIENLMVVPKAQAGETLAAAWFRGGAVARQERQVRERADEVLAFLRLTHVRDERAGNLSGGQKKLLELGRTMMAEPRVVLLDEIAAGVNRTLLKDLSDDILRLNREHGYTFFVIEHDMDLIAKLCDPVIVMAEGSVLMRGSMDEIRGNEAVVEAYFGGGVVHPDAGAA